MKLHHIVIICALVCFAGCRKTDPRTAAHIEALRSEKLWLEDQYYALEAQNKQAAELLASTRSENRELRIRLGMDVPVNEPRLANPTPLEAIPGGPSIELGTPIEPGSPDRASLPIGTAVPASYQAVEEPADRRVTHIVLDPRLTMGHDFDQRAGDDGISVLVQPRNADDQFVSVPAHVSIVVLDPQQKDTNPNVGRWEIDTQEAEQKMLRTIGHGQGIYLRLPWPNGYPKHSKLHMFVRYTSLNGEKLQAETELYVDLPGQLSARWTPKSTSREEPSGQVELSTYYEDEPRAGIARPSPRPQWSPNR